MPQDRMIRLRYVLKVTICGSGNSSDTFLCTHSNIQHTTSLLIRIAIIKGPPSTPFEGRDFIVRLDVPVEYPLTPPAARFVTKCFHPNVNFESGEICLDILKKEWSPAWSLQSACRAIQSLLGDPNSDVSNIFI